MFEYVDPPANDNDLSIFDVFEKRLTGIVTWYESLAKKEIEDEQSGIMQKIADKLLPAFVDIQKSSGLLETERRDLLRTYQALAKEMLIKHFIACPMDVISYMREQLDKLNNEREIRNIHQTTLSLLSNHELVKLLDESQHRALIKLNNDAKENLRERN